MRGGTVLGVPGRLVLLAAAADGRVEARQPGGLCRRRGSLATRQRDSAQFERSTVGGLAGALSGKRYALLSAGRS